jgi:hypothetical protein
MLMKDAIQQYQCPGCINGCGVSDCEKSPLKTEGPIEKGCPNHSPGTILGGLGVIALGLPKGFNRYGTSKAEPIEVWESFDQMIEKNPNLGTIFSIPVWKHLDEHGNTITRWYSPRTNAGWSMVILKDCRHRMPNTMEVSKEEIDNMD